MLDLEIIFEDISVAVVDKPSGLMVHGDGRTTDLTLADLLLKKYPSMKDVGEPIVLDNGETIGRYGIVHRLDRDTSGAMIVAKTNEMFLYLKRQFQKRKVLKEYHSFVYGEFAKKRGSIDAPMGRSKNDFRKRTTKHVRGDKKEAHTEYVASESVDGVSFVKFFPKTGRTHQIRVHAQLMGHPIVCDALYAQNMEKYLGLDRLALHSKSITLPFPGGEERTFISGYPDDFRMAVDSFEESKMDL